jgi:hypothetical protein
MHTIVASHARHRNAVDSYTRTAATIPADRWRTPRAEGKWSPAEITAHLTLTFDAITRELRGEGAMQPRLGGWKLMLARLTVMRRILADGRFYTGARAPRETRPEGALKSQEEALRDLREAAARLEKQFDATAAAQPDFKLAHPYFGAIGLGDAIFMSARHVEHHQTQLPVI